MGVIKLSRRTRIDGFVRYGPEKHGNVGKRACGRAKGRGEDPFWGAVT